MRRAQSPPSRLILQMRCAGASMGRATAPGARTAPAEAGCHAACIKPRRGTPHAAPARVFAGGLPPRPPPPGGRGGARPSSGAYRPRPPRAPGARPDPREEPRHQSRACYPDRAWPRNFLSRRAGVPLPHAAPTWGASVRPCAAAVLAAGHRGRPGTSCARSPPPPKGTVGRVNTGQSGVAARTPCSGSPRVGQCQVLRAAPAAGPRGGRRLGPRCHPRSIQRQPRSLRCAPQGRRLRRGLTLDQPGWRGADIEPRQRPRPAPLQLKEATMRQPTAEEITGMAWWNGLTETARRYWFGGSLLKPNRGSTPSMADAWTATEEQAAEHRFGWNRADAGSRRHAGRRHARGMVTRAGRDPGSDRLLTGAADYGGVGHDAAPRSRTAKATWPSAQRLLQSARCSWCGSGKIAAMNAAEILGRRRTLPPPLQNRTANAGRSRFYA